jgi:hypothetical protein
MKKLLLVLLVLGAVVLLSSCAGTVDKTTYIQSLGYTIVYPIQDPSSSDCNNFLIINKDHQVGIATCGAEARARIPRLTKIVWLPYKLETIELK